MANSVPTVIPKYIDKSVYYVTSDEQEYSYNIRSTYKGILRLSPNNGSSLKENTNVQFTDFTGKDFITYKDSINDFLDPASSNSQMIRVSTSDGNFLDMRLNINDVEFDNLYVDGILSGKPLNGTPFSHDNKNTVLLFAATNDETPIMLGKNTYLPAQANKRDFSSERDKNDPLDVINPIDFKDLLTDNTDNSSILTAKIVDGKRMFQYKDTNELIEELIQDALMSFCTLPTGSIHFVPVSVKEYMGLVKKSDDASSVISSLPNYVIDNGINEPIVRDFLLCDGRKYYIKDFPELAKVLAGMKISYERLVTLSGGEQVWRRFEDVNNYSEEKTWFRVPDLRHKFIRSPYLSSDLVGNEYNDTGVWNADNMPTMPQNKNSDNHYHFIALPEYNADCTRSNFNKDECNGMVLNGAPADMPPDGKPQYDLFTTCNSVGNNAHGLENHTPVVHFFTIPNTIDDGNYKHDQFVPNKGLTSENITDDSAPDDINELNFGIYKNRVNDYNLNSDTYGMENAPEFYACVPVIKI